MTLLAIAEFLKSQFPDKIGDVKELGQSDYQKRFGSFIPVTDAAAIRDIAMMLRDEPRLAFDSLLLLSTVDNNDGTLSVVYHLESTTHRHVMALKVTIASAEAEVPSVTMVWPHANWHEREAYDMMGITFTDHPDLRRILLDEDYPGHPLRKDFKEPIFYHGMKVPY